MFSHYFTHDKTTKTKPEELKIKIKSKNIIIFTVRGLFSYKDLDYGTRLMLEKIPNLNNCKILDLGCGIGIVGIYIAIENPSSKILSSDINELAIKVTNQNIKKLNLKNMKVVKSDIFQNIDSKFDIILTNPPFSAGKSVCTEFIIQSYEHLCENGKFYLVAPTNKGAKSYAKIIENTFGNLETIAMNKGFRLFLAIKK